MNFDLVLTKRVHNQLVEVLDWYFENAKGHEIKILKSFDKSLLSIKKNPYKCQIRYDNVRIYFIESYKFGIHYTIEKQTIFILGFFHQHQADSHWILKSDK